MFLKAEWPGLLSAAEAPRDRGPPRKGFFYSAANLGHLGASVIGPSMESSAIIGKQVGSSGLQASWNC
jgi:hypothetical protein